MGEYHSFRLIFFGSILTSDRFCWALVSTGVSGGRWPSSPENPYDYITAYTYVCAGSGNVGGRVHRGKIGVARRCESDGEIFVEGWGRKGNHHDKRERKVGRGLCHPPTPGRQRNMVVCI